MSDTTPTPPTPISRYRSRRYRHAALPLELGSVYITASLNAFIDGDAAGDAQCVQALLLHQGGEWSMSVLDQEDQRTNDEALDSGARVLTAWDVTAHGHTERVYVITEGTDDNGRRAVTTLMLASDY